MKVLVVDDFSTQRKYIINILRDMGIEEFSEAANGIEAIERLRNDDEINIIILDWLMPHMDGLAFLKLIRAQADFMDIPVLFVTNVDQKKDIVEALKYNIDGY
ncbi:MAG: response regulator, partial [Bacteroidota bacterium]